MPETSQLLVFIAAGLLLNLTPGPDLLYILGHALRPRPGAVRAGIVATLGVITGCLVHVAIAAAGLGALLAASTTAFGVVKWLGAAYLIYLGWRSWRASAAAAGLDRASASLALPSDAAIFRNGLLTNLLNPKVVLFFLAFLPQFIAPEAADVTAAFVLLGLIFCGNSLLFCLGCVWVAAWAGQRLGGLLAPARPWFERAAGLMFVGFGLRLALAEAPAR